MVLSFIITDIFAANYILNEFSKVIDGYEIERNPITGQPEMIVLWIPAEFEEDALQIKGMIEMMAYREGDSD